MTESSKKNRIIFIDLMRAIAVIQMVQGHTVDMLLANEFRTLDSPFFAVWFFLRGMTAPIFLFTAGIVFAYLFKLANKPFEENPRVKKGIKRFFLLVALGYLLRYPTYTIFDFSQVTQEQWTTFFAVDVLELIGFGILFVMILAYISEKFKLNDYLTYGMAAFIIFALSPIMESINWSNFLPVPVAGYFYSKTGSLFPLFPWSGYVVAGAVLGSYLAKNPMIFKTKKFSLNIGIIGIAFFISSFIIKFFEVKYNILNSDIIYMISLRLGFVLILNAAVSFISLKVKSIPRLIILVGRNTLLIYVVHLIILFGSAWNPGLNLLFEKSFNIWRSIGTALLMIIIMTGMVILVNKFKIRNKQLVT